MRPRLTTGLVIFLSTLAVYTFSLNGVWAVDHATSFLQLDYAMWAHHSFIIASGSSPWPGTVDDFLYNGNFYSALAPGTALLGLPFAGVGFLVDGGFTLFGTSTIFAESFVALSNSIAAVLVYLVGRFFFDKKVSAFLAFAYAFSTISWAFATYFFQSDVSAMWCLLSVFLVMRATRRQADRLRDSVLAGGAVAVAMLVDYINAIFLLILLSYLALSLRRDGQKIARPAAAFAATGLIGVLLIGLYNYASFGSPLLGSEQLYLHTSSVFGEFSNPLYSGAFLNLFSPYRGLFVYCIFLVLGPLGLYEMVRRSPYRREALLFLACFLAIFVPYSMWYDPSGGEGFGPRFLVAAIPYLLLPAGIVIERGDLRLRATAYVLYAAGVIVNGIAGVTSAVTPSYKEGVWPFLAWVYPVFLRDGVDVWWSRYITGSSRLYLSELIIGSALLIPLVTIYVLNRKETAGKSRVGPRGPTPQ